ADRAATTGGRAGRPALVPVGFEQMKPGRFAYRAPTDLDEALALLGDHGDEAKVLAGGPSLMPMLTFRLAGPEYLIDINRLPGLDSIQQTQRGWRVPALVRQRTLERSAEV